MENVFTKSISICSLEAAVYGGKVCAWAPAHPRDPPGSKQSQDDEFRLFWLPVWRRYQNDNLLLGVSARPLHHTPTL